MARAGVEATLGVGGGSDTVTPGAIFGYEERPTVTYVPIEGREFAQHMLSSIPVGLIFAAAQEGWTVETLMRIGISRIGAVENMSFEHIPPPGQIELSMQTRREVEKGRQFQHVIGLLSVLANADAIEVRDETENDAKRQYIVFGDDLPHGTRAMVNELKQLLGMSSDRNKFFITERATGIREDEISIQTRSLMAMMNYLSKGINVPSEHIENGTVLGYEIPTAETGGRKIIPFRMHASKNRPEKSFAAVRYQDYWYYVDNRDIDSKITLGLVIALFRILAPSGGGAAPILTLPTG